jgi:hypothetical protein
MPPRDDIGVDFRLVGSFPEPAFAALQREAFADHEPSQQLTDVLAAEAAARVGVATHSEQGALRIAAFRGDTLVAWTYGCLEGKHRFHMVNSGVAVAERRRGVYSQLVRMTTQHAQSQGCASIVSRHVPANVAVIIAKLHQGFQVSGFEYSEVYGPLVRLSYLVSEPRRALYRARTQALKAVDSQSFPA